PEPAGDVDGEAMTELARQHDDLAAMMSLVRDEVGEDMRHVQRQVAPDIAPRRRHVASIDEAELEERCDSLAASFESRQQFAACDRSSIDRGGSCDAVLPAQHFDPGAAGVVNVSQDNAD